VAFISERIEGKSNPLPIPPPPNGGNYPLPAAVSDANVAAGPSAMNPEGFDQIFTLLILL
jgi:hypothetical protein